MNPTCPEIQARLTTGGWPMADDRAAWRHLDECDECTGLLAAEADGLLRDLPAVPVSPRLADDVVRRVRAEQHVGREDGVLPLLASAVGVVVVASLVGFLLLGDSIRPAPPSGAMTPAGPDLPPVAAVTSLEGVVKIKPVGEFEWRTATRHVPLHRNDLLRTAAASTAGLVFFDGTSLTVRPDSLVAIDDSWREPESDRSTVRWRVDNGGVQFRVPATPGVRQVRTPGLTATVHGSTDAGVQVAIDGTTEVRLTKGRMDIASPRGDTVQLVSGEGVRVGRDGHSQAKFALPPEGQVVEPPVLRVEPVAVHGLVVHVLAVTHPGARVTINGQPVAVDPHGRINEFVTLRGAGTHEILVRAERAGSVSQHSQQVTIGP
jgi:hypothetical protein